MKSRLAMMAVLALGIAMSGTGAGLAVTGLSSNGDASVAQYGPPLPCDFNGDGTVDATEDLNGDAPGCDRADVLPDFDTGGDCDANADGIISPTEALADGCGGVKGETDESDNAPDVAPDRESGAQPTRQAAAGGGDELPFTGFAALPILIGGMVLLAGGLVLRRRTTS